MDELVTTSLAVQDNIKDFFSIYYWWNGNYFIWDRGMLRGMKTKYIYYFDQQKIKLNLAGFTPKLNMTISGCMDKLFGLVNDGFIPKRYMPTVIEIPKAWHKQIYMSKRKGGTGYIKYPFGYKKLQLFRIDMPEPIISLIEQSPGLGLPKELVLFFKLLNEHDKGIEFDKYIDKWTKECMAKYYGVDEDEPSDNQVS